MLQNVCDGKIDKTSKKVVDLPGEQNKSEKEDRVGQERITK